MGFVSLAQDYVEHRLDLNDLLIYNPINTFRVDTPEGFVLVNSVARIKPGDMIAY